MKLAQFFLSFAILLVPQSSQRPPASSASTEQYLFSAEDDAVKRPARIPDEVIALLSADRDIQLTLKTENVDDGKLPISWFLASEVHLNAVEEQDLVVIGTGPLLGANVTTFWIFRSIRNHFELLLKVVAHDLEITNTRSAGYKDIETTTLTATRISNVRFTFNGKTYEPGARSSTVIQ